ncbi:MAG: FAD-dependent oxidoreductase [Euryarchaeota archaeon]|nr:FAD-dependent oxidoreductase [Euryarchaeota archaeon]
MRVDVLVIGGGATGAGIVRDLSMRGVDVMLLEKGDFCSGSSGGNHGLLHSGARYAVKDPESAKECVSESRILKGIAWNCIEDTGGMFVSVGKDDPGFADVFHDACKATGVRAARSTAKELHQVERNLSDDVADGFLVDDAVIDPFRLVLTNIEDARRHGATVRNHCEVVSFERSDGHIGEVKFKDQRNGSVGSVVPEVVVNAAGSSSGSIASMVGGNLAMTRDYGTLVVFSGKLVSGTVNRLRPPSDGDIIVPSHTSMIAGTTSRSISGPSDARPTIEDKELIIKEVSEMVPALRGARAIRAYGASRPLASGSSGRGASRTFKLIDHEEGGVDNLISIIGGKLTTYRMMAERTSDAVCAKLGVRANCTTGEEVMEASRLDEAVTLVSASQSESMRRRYGHVPSEMMNVVPVGSMGVQSCSCENVMRFELEHYASSEDVITIADLMRRTRAGMGYCQGTGCMWEMASALSDEGDIDLLIRDFVRERREGSSTVIEGDQLRQEMFRSHLLWPFQAARGGEER